jgi:hypothetical protein
MQNGRPRSRGRFRWVRASRCVRALTRALLVIDHPAAAHASCGAERRPAMNDLIVRNHNGPEVVMQLAEEPAARSDHHTLDTDAVEPDRLWQRETLGRDPF